MQETSSNVSPHQFKRQSSNVQHGGHARYTQLCYSIDARDRARPCNRYGERRTALHCSINIGDRARLHNKDDTRGFLDCIATSKWKIELNCMSDAFHLSCMEWSFWSGLSITIFVVMKFLFFFWYYKVTSLGNIEIDYVHV